MKNLILLISSLIFFIGADSDSKKIKRIEISVLSFKAKTPYCVTIEGLSKRKLPVMHFTSYNDLNELDIDGQLEALKLSEEIPYQDFCLKCTVVYGNFTKDELYVLQNQYIYYKGGIYDPDCKFLKTILDYFNESKHPNTFRCEPSKWYIKRGDRKYYFGIIIF